MTEGYPRLLPLFLCSLVDTQSWKMSPALHRLACSAPSPCPPHSPSRNSAVAWLINIHNDDVITCHDDDVWQRMTWLVSWFGGSAKKGPCVLDFFCCCPLPGTTKYRLASCTAAYIVYSHAKFGNGRPGLLTSWFTLWISCFTLTYGVYTMMPIKFNSFHIWSSLLWGPI